MLEEMGFSGEGEGGKNDVRLGFYPTLSVVRDEAYEFKKTFHGYQTTPAARYSLMTNLTTAPASQRYRYLPS